MDQPEPTLYETLELLLDSALKDGMVEIQRAEETTSTGIIRLNISLAVRHGRKQGASTSLVFERKLGS